MAKLLLEKEIKPEKLITSSAVRAFDTAKLMAKEFKYARNEIVLDERLYLPSTLDFLRVINEIDNSISEVILFSHNPGITDFANYVSTYNIDNIPTCGIVCIQFDINDWKDLPNNKGAVVFFEFPKKYFT